MMKQFAIVFPCFNEEKIIPLFLEQLNGILVSYADVHQFDLIMVDDASLDETILAAENYKKNNPGLSLTILSLGYNMGHQEAIRQGLQCVAASGKTYAGIIVMDSDGEDNPEALHKLIAEDNFDVVFVERGKRSESWIFKLGYYFYKNIFRLITGRKINFGNYSMISHRVLQSTTRQKYFHYSGFLSKSRFSIKKIKYDRLKRIDGKSKMSYKSLVFHGLYSLVEYAEEILFSLIKIFAVILLALFAIGIHIVYSKYIVEIAPYGWSSTIAVNLLISALIIISSIIICLLQISIKRSISQRDLEFTIIDK
jgi:glycosyltransferase involved in cell wall biosynthesis